MLLPTTRSAGWRNKRASQYDFLPTLLEYAGVEHQTEYPLPGKSFAGAMRGQTGGRHEHVVVFDEYGPVRMVRTPTFKYVHRYSTGPHHWFQFAG